MTGFFTTADSPPVLAVLLLLLTVLSASNKVRSQVPALLALGLAGTLNLVPYRPSFRVFANPAVILIAAMMVLGESLQRTGVTARLGRWVAAAGGEAKTSGLLMWAAAIPSALISDVGVITIFIRMIEGMRKTPGTSPFPAAPADRLRSEPGWAADPVGQFGEHSGQPVAGPRGINRFFPFCHDASGRDPGGGNRCLHHRRGE